MLPGLGARAGPTANLVTSARRLWVSWTVEAPRPPDLVCASAPRRAAPQTRESKGKEPCPHPRAESHDLDAPQRSARPLSPRGRADSRRHSVWRSRLLQSSTRRRVSPSDLQNLSRGKPREGHPHPPEPLVPTTRSIHGPNVTLPVPFRWIKGASVFVSFK